jgi:glycosyltransferase involved in cell wall biosynthesis
VRILHINTENGWRGGERQTLLTLDAMEARGESVELFSRLGSELTQAALAEGFTVHTGIGLLSLFFWLLFNAKNFDVLHAHNAASASMLAAYRLFGKTLTVFTRRTDFSSRRKRLFRRLKWRLIDQLVAISHSAALEPIRLGLRPTIIRSAVPQIPPNLLRITQLLNSYRLSGKTLVGTAATFTSDKDPITCIRVAERVCETNPNVIFLHWGVEGELETIAKNYVSDLGLADRYLFLGFVTNPEEFYSSLSAFLLTSRHEALGTCVLDAMTQRVPVVATSVGGLRETLAAQRGLLANPGDVETLSHQLIEALTPSRKISEMVDRAYQFVREKHNVDKMADRYLNLYENKLRLSSFQTSSTLLDN